MRTFVFAILYLLSTAQPLPAVLLTPEFGQGSYIFNAGDWSSNHMQYSRCEGTYCGSGDGRSDGMYSGLWEARSVVFGYAYGASGPGSASAWVHAEVIITVDCYDTDCTGPSPVGWDAQGSAGIFGDLLIDAPRDGILSFESFMDGRSQGVTWLPVTRGLHQIAQIDMVAWVYLAHAQLGTASKVADHLYEVRNVQLTPEPATYALTGLGLLLAAIKSSRRRD